MSSEKYKLFRNYMANELGITRDDIKEWAMQGAFEAANKHLNGVDFDEHFKRAMTSVVRGEMASRFGSGQDSLRTLVAKELAKNLTIIGYNSNASKDVCDNVIKNGGT